MVTFTHRNPEMQLQKPRTALVLADMQNEFLEAKTGTYYELIADGLRERNVIGNLERLLKTAQELGYFVIHSPHYYYPTDLQWVVPPGAIGDYLRGIGFVGRKDPTDLEGFCRVAGRLLRAVQEVPDGRAHLQYGTTQDLRVRVERRHQAAPDAQGREGDHGGPCREHLPGVPHARHHRGGHGGRDGP